MFHCARLSMAHRVVAVSSPAMIATKNIQHTTDYVVCDIEPVDTRVLPCLIANGPGPGCIKVSVRRIRCASRPRTRKENRIRDLKLVCAIVRNGEDALTIRRTRSRVPERKHTDSPCWGWVETLTLGILVQVLSGPLNMRPDAHFCFSTSPDIRLSRRCGSQGPSTSPPHFPFFLSVFSPGQ